MFLKNIATIIIIPWVGRNLIIMPTVRGLIVLLVEHAGNRIIFPL